MHGAQCFLKPLLQWQLNMIEPKCQISDLAFPSAELLPASEMKHSNRILQEQSVHSFQGSDQTTAVCPATSGSVNLLFLSN